MSIMCEIPKLSLLHDYNGPVHDNLLKALKSDLLTGPYAPSVLLVCIPCQRFLAFLNDDKAKIAYSLH